MNRKRRAAITALCAGILLLALWGVPRLTGRQAPPGLAAEERVLLRIWAVGAPGGGQAWLKQQLHAFEKQHPGTSSWLRTVPAEELTAPDVVLPDVVLYMPGDVSAPDQFFLPLSGEMTTRSSGLLREELLRCGRWQNQQYGLPLCWSAWVLAIDSALEPGSAQTPAPTTLLGRPAATASAGATQEPGYPLAAASGADCPLQSPGGAALFSLGLLLEERPPLPQDFGTLSPQTVYSAFQKKQCATAMLTTGQAAAFASLTSGGGGFAHRILTPQEIVTDQVWLASVTREAPPEAALLLSFLTSSDAQRALSSQALHTVRRDLALYAADIPARVEYAAAESLAAINAYIPQEQVRQASWQFFQGQCTLSEALLPLM